MSEALDLIGIIRHRARVLEPLPSGLATKGALAGPVKAVLFDLYGTLFISASGSPDFADPPPVTKQLSSLLGSYGIERDPDTVLRTLRTRIRGEHERMRSEGVDFPEIRIESVWRDVLAMENIERVRRFAVEYECLVNPVWPMPYAKELVAELRAAGVTLGLISNAQFFTPLLFRVFFDSTEAAMGFDEELIFYSYLHGRAKPSLYPFEKAKDLLGERSIPPENALFVGNDVENDVLPARKSGFQTALFCGDRRSDLRSLRTGNVEPELGRRPPDIVAASLKELSAVLKKGLYDHGSSQRTS